MIMILSSEIAQMPKDSPILRIFLSFIPFIPRQKKMKTKLEVWELCEGEVLMAEVQLQAGIGKEESHRWSYESSQKRQTIVFHNSQI